MSISLGKLSTRAAQAFNILIVLVGLSGCAQHSGPAPVYDRQQPPSQKLTTHWVSRGETLFSIAWRYGKDFKTLAALNGISAPYTIFPGQRLQLEGRLPALASSRSSTKRQPLSPKSKPQQPSKVTTLSTTVKVTPATPTVVTADKTRSKKETRKSTSPPANSVSFSRFQWQWPALGKVTQYFKPGSSTQKGIDIDGRLGQSVVAAGPGAVVYAGSGLRGYGNLVIIKHNDTYLSAYAHNSTILVREGEMIKAGQKIAEIGSSGTNKNKLHFEIRKEGKPVNPLAYLPKK